LTSAQESALKRSFAVSFCQQKPALIFDRNLMNARGGNPTSAQGTRRAARQPQQGFTDVRGVQRNKRPIRTAGSARICSFSADLGEKA
jgi:hypothetical protein